MNAKTQARIERMLAAAGITSDTPDATYDRVREVALAILTEQDSDTRHACAEAVTILADPFIGPFPTAGDRCKSHGFAEAKTAAHQACMNTQAV